MMLRCSKCNIENKHDFNDNVPSSVMCSNCFHIIIISSDMVYNVKPELHSIASQVLFKIGDLVKIDNGRSPWHNEVAIIRDFKPGFYRLELLGMKTWIPEHWITELNEIS